ncbi:MAG: SWIM zinc finger family protein [Clostridium septicum]|mgnify:CR=1 FL=1|uniref:SWIM zinc finger family protein n=1 Tax=Clostridium septicum TaxID=1504 RepID=UPI0025830DD5|nr:SWIM zinc finger family protein [Clostridium septicum]MDU1314792.1 SWIM zinc finger family protein [Clostridium septicum]
MLVINTDASSREEKPKSIIGYIIFKDDKVINQEVKEIDLTKEMEVKRRNKTIYLELLSVLLVLEYLLSIGVKIDYEIDIYNDNTTVIYILNRLFINKRKITKIEEILKAELENAKNMVSKIGSVKFKYISSKDNKAHNILENYRKAYKVYEKLTLLEKWKEDIQELEIESIKEGMFIVTTLKGNNFIVDLENNTCTCKYFYYNRKICKHIIACKKYK